MVTRRRFLAGAAVAAAGTAAVTVTAVQNPLDLPAASAAPGERFRYRNRDVVVTPGANSAHITVNGRHGVHVDRDGNDYLTHLLPFSAFRSPRKLAEATIDAEDAGLLINRSPPALRSGRRLTVGAGGRVARDEGTVELRVEREEVARLVGDVHRRIPEVLRELLAADPDVV